MRNQEKGKNLSRAVALRYTPKGSGPVAEKIIALAKEHGIPIQEDRALVQVLSQLDFYEEIPPSIYGLVAEILAFIYSLNQKHRSMPKG
jgi:flagellar biosynthesis protein